MYAKANSNAGQMDLHFSSGRSEYEGDRSDLTIRGGDVGIGTNLPTAPLTVAADSASAELALKRTNTNVTGAYGAINWQAMDGHSVASMYALGDGDNEGAHLILAATSAASADDPYGIGERLRIGSGGQIGLGGANYGTAGQVLTSNGSGSAVSWEDASGGGGITTEAATPSNAVVQINLTDATDHKITATGICTITTTTAGTEGQSHTIRIVNSGIATVGFSTYFLFPSGSVPSLPTADGAVSIISFTVHDSVGAGCTQLLAGASLNFS